MVWRHENEEAIYMNCHVCGSILKPISTTLPFKITPSTIVILKDLPVMQCEQCGEYLLEDSVMARVERIFDSVDHSAELEIIRYAA
jgi:YgiT-type zinc finger domain-containing protein